ncbi:SPOSA6832_00083, partial [Sporobolomyces salmonicolor]
MPAQLDRPAPPAVQIAALRENAVPIESLQDACRACDGCDEDDEELGYPKGEFPVPDRERTELTGRVCERQGFQTDQDSTMLGELKAYGSSAESRQILISTGKSDWEREVTDNDASLAGLVRKAYDDAASGSSGSSGSFFGKLASKLAGKGEEPPKVPGVHGSLAQGTSTSSRLSILNSSFISHSHEGHKESVMVFPDFKVVHEVEEKREIAEELVKQYLSTEAGRTGAAEGGKLRSWPLPYHAVILLCSHRRRDKRCSIAAPLLISQFHHHLGKHGFEVDERGEDLDDGPPIEEWEGTPEEKEVRLKETLQGVKTDGGRVGLFKVSHVGGHKHHSGIRFAGVCILYFPNGSAVWLGRITPADVGILVDRTIIGGQVIPEFLRGGLGLTGKNGAKGILDW